MVTTTTPVPSLSPVGWITSPAEKADLLLAHFFLTNGKQSYLFNGHVKSCQAILQENSGNMLSAANAMRIALLNMLGPYYDDVKVDVTTDEKDQPSSKVTMTVRIGVTDRGVQYSYQSLVNVVDSKLNQFINLNNTGIVYNAITGI